VQKILVSKFQWSVLLDSQLHRHLLISKAKMSYTT